MVISASVIAITGGSSAQTVPYRLPAAASSPAASTGTPSRAAANAASSAARRTECFFMEFLLSFSASNMAEHEKMGA